MAVVYETGVASTPLDLLTKLLTFATGNGWTNNTPTTGDTVLSKATVYIGIDALTDRWRCRGALGFSGAAAFDNQPNNAGASFDFVIGAGPYTAYHFFTGDEGGADYLHIALELTQGVYRHWAIGEVVKFGTFTGGVYTDATLYEETHPSSYDPDSIYHRYICDTNNEINSSCRFWVDYDSKVNNWQPLQYTGTGNANSCTGTMRKTGMITGPFEIGYQRWNLRTPLWPLTYFANRASSLRSPIGRMPNMRAVNMRNFTDAELITIGGEIWQVFPVFQRQTAVVAAPVVSSGLYGYAHRRS